MFRAFRLLLLLGFIGSGFVAAAEVAPGPVFIAPLKSEVSNAQFYFLRRALKQAERENASAFIIDMETPGGELGAALKQMDALLTTTVPTYTYVNPRALSAGALIAVATRHIYMSPTAVIGAAAPVLSGGEDLAKTMKQKTVSAISATARAAAQRNGHNPDVADAFINDRELKIGDVVINKADALLTLSAEEAVREYEGKPLLAAGIATSIDDLLKQAKLTGPLVHLEPTGSERVALWITSLAPIFLLGGIIGGYIEYKVPGFGLPGLVSLCCFALFFFGHYIAGLAGAEVFVIFGLGLALVLVEVFVLPGTIIPGIAGALLMLGALIFAMVDRWPSQPFWPSGDMLLRPMLHLGIAMLLSLVAIAFLARQLPRSSLYGRLVLLDTVPGSEELPREATAPLLPIGAAGLARTPLRPSGKGEFGEQIVDVVSSGSFVDAGKPLRVVAVEGVRVVVEET